MSVYKRKTTAGTTEHYHYKFFHAGKFYYGVCDDCHTLAEAKKFEDSVREKVKRAIGSAEGFRKATKIIERIKDTVLGDEGTKKILLSEAYDLAMSRPRKKQTGESYSKQKRSHWRDFMAYMTSEHPKIKYVHEVNRTDHAEPYIAYIRKHGRFDKNVQRGGAIKKQYAKNYNISSASANLILKTLREVFGLVCKMDGVDLKNPFADIATADCQSEAREIFTNEELDKIFTNADDFLFPLFRIGLATGLREGDVCKLKWSEVDFADGGHIHKKTSKTGHVVDIPMTPWLYQDMLKLKEKKEDAEFVLPRQAEAYDKGVLSGIIKNFLHSLGIETTRKVKGRDRLVSVKDFHSLRHQFAYIAGIMGTPLPIVKSILGHMTEGMTELYQRHATREEKRRALEKMPSFIRGGGVASPSPTSGLSDAAKLRAIKDLLLGASELSEREKRILCILNGEG